MSFVSRLTKPFRRGASWWRSDMVVAPAAGDRLPCTIPALRVVHLIDNGVSWAAGLNCPCGCGDVIELMLLADVDPRWTLEIDDLDRPSLTPSVWRTVGCRSHFWVRRGQVEWVGRS